MWELKGGTRKRQENVEGSKGKVTEEWNIKRINKGKGKRQTGRESESEGWGRGSIVTKGGKGRGGGRMNDNGKEEKSMRAVGHLREYKNKKEGKGLLMKVKSCASLHTSGGEDEAGRRFRRGANI